MFVCYLQLGLTDICKKGYKNTRNTRNTRNIVLHIIKDVFNDLLNFF